MNGRRIIKFTRLVAFGNYDVDEHVAIKSLYSVCGYRRTP